MIFIETERLIIRNWEDKDTPKLVQMHQDDEVMRYFLTKLTEIESLAFIDKVKSEIKERNYGLWAVESKETGEFIGFVGLHRVAFDADFTPCVEIGWRLLPQFWHKGYATEAARACIEYGFKKANLSEIYAFTSLPNIPSQKVMQRIGMQHVKQFGHPLVEENHTLYQHVLYKIVKN